MDAPSFEDVLNLGFNLSSHDFDLLSVEYANDSPSITFVDYLEQNNIQRETPKVNKTPETNLIHFEHEKIHVQLPPHVNNFEINGHDLTFKLNEPSISLIGSPIHSNKENKVFENKKEVGLISNNVNKKEPEFVNKKVLEVEINNKHDDSSKQKEDSYVEQLKKKSQKKTDEMQDAQKKKDSYVEELKKKKQMKEKGGISRELIKEWVPLGNILKKPIQNKENLEQFKKEVNNFLYKNQKDSFEFIDISKVNRERHTKLFSEFIESVFDKKPNSVVEVFEKIANKYNVSKKVEEKSNSPIQEKRIASHHSTSRESTTTSRSFPSPSDNNRKSTIEKNSKIEDRELYLPIRNSIHHIAPTINKRIGNRQKIQEEAIHVHFLRFLRKLKKKANHHSTEKYIYSDGASSNHNKKLWKNESEFIQKELEYFWAGVIKNSVSSTQSRKDVYLNCIILAYRLCLHVSRDTVFNREYVPRQKWSQLFPLISNELDAMNEYIEATKYLFVGEYTRIDMSIGSGVFKILKKYFRKYFGYFHEDVIGLVKESISFERGEEIDEIVNSLVYLMKGSPDSMEMALMFAKFSVISFLQIWKLAIADYDQKKIDDNEMNAIRSSIIFSNETIQKEWGNSF